MSAYVPTLTASSFTFSRPPSRCGRLHPARPAVRRAPRAALDALLFDCDGVLADTERDAHRVAFNLAFAERGLDVVWDEAQYGELLATGGGKERMKAFWTSAGTWPEGLDGDAEGQDALVRALHARKTALFMELVGRGAVPLRPGVARLVAEARAADVRVGVCSTSNERAVGRIVAQLGADADGVRVFAGDVVERKKPAPDVYLLAAKEMGLESGKVCVVEDSFIGLTAARAAGMPCVVTKSSYTAEEDFGEAQMVVDSLEEPKVTLQALTEMVEGLGKGEKEGEIEGGVGGRGGKVRRLRRRFGSSYL